MQIQRECFNKILEALKEIHTYLSPETGASAPHEPRGLPTSTLGHSDETQLSVQRRLSNIPAALDATMHNPSMEMLQNEDIDSRQQAQKAVFTDKFQLSAAICLHDPSSQRLRSARVQMRWDSQSEVNIVSKRIIDRYDLVSKTEQVDVMLKGLKGMETRCTSCIELTWYDVRSPTIYESRFYVMEDEPDFVFDMILDSKWGQDHLDIFRRPDDSKKTLDSSTFETAIERYVSPSSDQTHKLTIVRSKEPREGAQSRN